VPPKNSQQLANEIVNLLQNDSKREALINKAQKFIKRYSWDSVGQKLEELYFKFLNK